MKHLLVTLALMGLSTAHATIPNLVRHQGRIIDADGVPLNQTQTLSFRIYDAGTGGTELWSETWSDVTLDGGYFSLELGGITAFPHDLFTGGPLDVVRDRAAVLRHSGERLPRVWADRLGQHRHGERARWLRRRLRW